MEGFLHVWTSEQAQILLRQVSCTVLCLTAALPTNLQGPLEATRHPCCRGREDAKPDYKSVPSVVFSSPQLAYVGLHEETAVEEVGDVDIYSSVSTYARG